jgi:hypothetical protein
LVAMHKTSPHVVALGLPRQPDGVRIGGRAAREARMTSAEYAEDIALGPDPDTDDGPPETDEDVAEVERLIQDAEAKADAVDRDIRAQGDWDLKGDD